jgi:hypothetical protein
MMSHNQSRPATRPANYEIVVLGELSQRFSAAFEGMTLLAADGQTTIAGPVVDQAQLHGLLGRVRDLGLHLVSVSSTLAPTAAASHAGRRA